MLTEKQITEFKESWRDEYLKWICGFANAQGGTLIIGKNDKGIITGLQDISILLEEIPNKVRDLLGIIVDVNARQESDKEYLEIDVAPYPYPINYKGQYHYRSGSTKQELKGAALDKLLLQKQGKKWDSIPVRHVSIKDLSSEAFAIFRKKSQKSKRLDEITLAEDNSLLLEKLKLIEGNYLSRGAILLFHPHPEMLITGAYVKIGFFRTNHDLLFHDVIEGHLFNQVEKTMDLLLTKYLKATISYERISRVETYPFPEEALRETLLNALAHKDYSSGVPIQISVYNDKIIFWNYGQLPDDWTIERLNQKHPSIPYNPAIATTFFRAGYIESWGRGIEKINEECKLAETPFPTFNMDFSGLMVTFSAKAETAIAKTSGKMSGKMSGKTSGKILDIMKANAQISIPELASLLLISSRSVERNIQKLKKEQKLIRVGPDKGGHWKVID